MNVRDQFPGLTDGWHYLDSAATAQKPHVVIDAIAQGYGADYASVHRGVYQRSALMTQRYEAARARAAAYIGGAADEIIFTRGATEAINLVAHCFPGVPGHRRRVLLSALEHHSNIVPWQLAGWQIDVCPLTADGHIDLDAADAMLSTDVDMIALAHVSNVLGSVLDVPRAAALARKYGACLLLDGCQAAPRLPVDVAALDCDFYVASAHKIYGPTGIGFLWGRAALLDAMPPYQGGGAMIDRVTFDASTYLSAPARFEAGTPHIVGALGMAAALDWLDGVGRAKIHTHEAALVTALRDELSRDNSITLYGPAASAGIVSFNLEGVHPHDVATILDDEGVAVRAGHHCAQPLMDALGVPATVRASFAAHSNDDDVAALLRGLDKVKRVFG